MNLNLKMTVERSKRRSYFLSLVFITKPFPSAGKGVLPLFFIVFVVVVFFFWLIMFGDYETHHASYIAGAVNWYMEFLPR